MLLKRRIGSQTVLQAAEGVLALSRAAIGLGLLAVPRRPRALQAACGPSHDEAAGSSQSEPCHAASLGAVASNDPTLWPAADAVPRRAYGS